MIILIVILLAIIALPLIIELSAYALLFLLAVGVVLIVGNSETAAALIAIGGAAWILYSIVDAYTPEKRAASKAYRERVKAERKIRRMKKQPWLYN